MSEPLIRETRKAYRASKTCEVDKLIAERRKWSRRFTIASNKLAEVESEIQALCVRFGTMLDTGKDPWEDENAK